MARACSPHLCIQCFCGFSGLCTSLHVRILGPVALLSSRGAASSSSSSSSMAGDVNCVAAHSLPSRAAVDAISLYHPCPTPQLDERLPDPAQTCRSTLVALLQRLYDPTHGKVLVDGQDLRSLDASWYAPVPHTRSAWGQAAARGLCFCCSSGCVPHAPSAQVATPARGASI